MQHLSQQNPPTTACQDSPIDVAKTNNSYLTNEIHIPSFPTPPPPPHTTKLSSHPQKSCPSITDLLRCTTSLFLTLCIYFTPVVQHYHFDFKGPPTRRTCTCGSALAVPRGPSGLQLPEHHARPSRDPL